MQLKKYFVRFVHISAVLLALCAFAPAQSSKTLSLIEEIKKEFPERQTQIAEKCAGAKIAVDADFASFGDNSDALLRVSQLGLKETANGFRRFCTDSNNSSQIDQAKVSALKTKVKKITLRHVAEAEQKKISLQPGGTILIEMKFDQPLGGGIDYVAMARKLGEIL
jgi:hypothetical protein